MSSTKVPAVGFAVFWVARNKSTVMGENRLMHLILLIELAMPSAAVRAISFYSETTYPLCFYTCGRSSRDVYVHRPAALAEIILRLCVYNFQTVTSLQVYRG